MSNGENNWKKWRETVADRNTYVHSLSSIGLPTFKIIYWVPKNLTPSELRLKEEEIQEASAKWMETVNKVSVEIDRNNAVVLANSILTVGADSLVFIKSWNITDPETDEPLPTPTHKDMEQTARTLAKLPYEVLFEITLGSKEAMDAIAPKALKAISYGQLLRGMLQLSLLGQEKFNSSSTQDLQNDN